MSAKGTGLSFRGRAARALHDSSLREAMRTATDMFAAKRAEAVARVPMDRWRDRASEIRLSVLDDLTTYVDEFAASATRNGALVHRAKDATSACDVVLNILRDRKVTKVVKSKSMVTEEIHLNQYLAAHGIDPVETDLGEYIVQIAGESPSHILAPAIHRNRQQIGRLFAEKLGVDYSDDPEVLTKVARRILRKEFRSAQGGISGANFAIADTGSLVLFTNEGNGRMVTTVPRLHIAVLSIEKVIPSIKDLPTFIRLLPRSASGQSLSSYVSVITGTRKRGEVTGAEELHIVLVDNGRTRIVTGECREILKCIRCSACLNVCPVYKVIGGHAYGSTYPGPMGIVLTNELEGLGKAHQLLEASTLCGACDEVCPVKVPLMKLIRLQRERAVREGYTSTTERAGMSAFGVAVKSPLLFAAGQKASRFAWPLLPVVSGSGTVGRMPVPAKETFKKRMQAAGITT